MGYRKYVSHGSTGCVYAIVLNLTRVLARKFGKIINWLNFFGLAGIMVLEWREREHEALYVEVIESDEALEALHLCGLKKLFQMNGMRAQPHMLDMLMG